MKKDTFEKLDASFMKLLKPIREKKISSEILKDFSAATQSKILAHQGMAVACPAVCRPGFIWALGLALFLVGISVMVQVPKKAPAVSEPETVLVYEIDSLRQLGAWTDDDELELFGAVLPAV